MSESSEITGPLVKMIREMGIMAERMNSGRVKVRGGWMQLHTAGTADILAFPAGRVLWMETKQPKGHTNKEQLDNQDEFERKVKALGHEYHRVTSIDQGIDLIRSNPPH